MKDEHSVELVQVKGYGSEYSEQGFFDKIKSVGKVVGRATLVKAMELYYAMQNPAMPFPLKALIVGSLGYFILPIDLIPDVIVGLGYTDDVAVFAAALAASSEYVGEEEERKAEEFVDELLG